MFLNHFIVAARLEVICFLDRFLLVLLGLSTWIGWLYSCGICFRSLSSFLSLEVLACYAASKLNAALTFSFVCG